MGGAVNGTCGVVGRCIDAGIPDVRTELDASGSLDAEEGDVATQPDAAADAGLRWFLASNSFAIVTTWSGSKPNFL